MQSLEETINIARGLVRNRDYREAEAVLFEAMKTNPNNAFILGNLADLYIRMERLDDAEKNVELILKREPANFYALQRKGDILAKRGKYNEALEIFFEIYKRNDKDYFIIKRIARVYLLMNKPERALEYSKIGCDKFPERADGFFLLYQIYNRLSDLENAKKAIARALEIDPNNKFFYSQKLSLRMEEKKFNSSNIQEILDISDDDNPHLLKLLADRLKKEGKFDEAVEVYKKLIYIDGSEFNQKGLAYLYYKKQEYKKAFKIFISLSDSNFMDNIFLSTIMASARENKEKKELVERMIQLAEGADQYRKLWSRIKKLDKEIEDE